MIDSKQGCSQWRDASIVVRICFDARKADDFATYFCSIHPKMKGTVVVE